METWVKALLGSAGGGVVLATISVFMGLKRLELLRNVRFSNTQKWQAWWIVFGVFTAFSFWAMSLQLVQR